MGFARGVTTIAVTIVERDGTVHAIGDAATGRSLMQAARDRGVDGILAECGGACACATCHVYVDEAWEDRVGPPHHVEDEILDLAPETRRPNSRLSCQIRLRAALDGLRVTVAPCA